MKQGRECSLHAACARKPAGISQDSLPLHGRCDYSADSVSTPPESSLVIRQILESDIPEFYRIIDEVCRERRYLAALEAPPLERMTTFVKNNVTLDHPHMVADAGGTLVGWCDAIPGEATSGAPHVARLGMGVVPSHRRQGIGERLLNAVLDKARSKDIEKIELGVYRANTGAIALYERSGFTVEGCRVRSRCVDGCYDDIILMALFLNA